MGMDVDSVAVRDACRNRHVAQVVDRLDRRQCVVDHRDTIKIDVVGSGCDEDAGGDVFRGAYRGQHGHNGVNLHGDVSARQGQC